ncbi:protein ecdysoneless homolog [Ammospiza caudacuta]|uniref:protein ecdysoneless homolog n=1 Tax=Ammospiza caudacuta TaxID=2857398 RepID=UPI002738882C|nr:protein ecdysoneless homolog [Ammospiza caudacuta]
MEALRRPALPEDAVRSRLFAAAAGPGGEALLRRCAELALVRLAPLLAVYVWQRQPFRLRYVPGRGEPGAGREARREERPERGDWEGDPAAGKRESVRGIRERAAGNRGHVRENRNRLKEPAAGNRELVRANRESVRDTWRPEPESFEGNPASGNRQCVRGSWAVFSRYHLVDTWSCDLINKSLDQPTDQRKANQKLEGMPAHARSPQIKNAPLGRAYGVRPVVVGPLIFKTALHHWKLRSSLELLVERPPQWQHQPSTAESEDPSKSLQTCGMPRTRRGHCTTCTGSSDRQSSFQLGVRRSWQWDFSCHDLHHLLDGFLFLPPRKLESPHICKVFLKNMIRGYQLAICVMCSRLVLPESWENFRDFPPPLYRPGPKLHSRAVPEHRTQDSVSRVWDIRSEGDSAARVDNLFPGTALLRRLSSLCPVQVTFTRCLYAQLVQQQFVPDRRSGYTLPAPAHPQYRACELGMKLAHGFEMLCSKSSKVAPDAKRNVLRGPLWERLLRSLKENDYFKGEMEGSAKYMELLHMAEDHFQQSVAVPESCDEVSPGDEILALLQTTPIDLKELEREAACLPAEDDDSWLDMTPGALDQMLKETRNESLPSPNEEEQNYGLETVAESMKAFVSKVSTQEGAEMPWSSDESQVTFDVDSFTKALDRILGADLEELDSDDVDEEEEFGFSAEDDEELDAGNGRQEQKVSPEELVGSLKAYMEEMDRELAQSNVGKSFSSHKRGGDSVGAAPCESAGPDCGAEAAELAALDVDMNLVAKLLESYSAQAGLAGPTSSILQSLGVNLPESTELTGS